MPLAEKIAVSLPAKTLQRLEVARKRLGRSRSAVVAEAIEHWLGSRAVGSEDRRYMEGYLKYPEHVGETASVAQAAIESWEPWE
jgi:metal-responsive CopG/Arc/MetJ family transcriptional regulator